MLREHSRVRWLRAFAGHATETPAKFTPLRAKYAINKVRSINDVQASGCVTVFGVAALQHDVNHAIGMALNDRRFPRVFPILAHAVIERHRGGNRHAIKRWIHARHQPVGARHHRQADQIVIEQQRIGNNVVLKFWRLIEWRHADVHPCWRKEAAI